MTTALEKLARLPPWCKLAPARQAPHFHPLAALGTETVVMNINARSEAQARPLREVSVVRYSRTAAEPAGGEGP